MVNNHLEDNNVAWFLEEIIESFSTEGNFGVGLPLGNLTSQLFVNIYMNKFDQFVKRELKVQYYVRYADDFVILHENKINLEKLLADISVFLKNELNLELNYKKVSISSFASGVDFLGWVNFPHCRVLRNSTKRRIVNRAREGLSERSKASYLGHLSHGNAYTVVTKYLGKEIIG